MGLSTNAQKVKDFFEGNNIGGDLFGHYDYWNVLQHQVQNQNWTGSVANARIGVLEYLRENEHMLWAGDPGQNNGNKRGQGGLYDFIEDGSNDRVFSGGVMGPQGDTSKTLFGYHDFIHARSHGKSDEEILRWMNNNVDRIDPGDPGLYAHIYNAGSNRPSDIPSSLNGAGTTTGSTAPSADDSRFIITGKGGSLFGDADYRELLNRTDGTPQALVDVRNDVLAWIQGHRNAGTLDTILWPGNQPNTTPGENDDGLYERINTGTPDFDRDEGGRFFSSWGDPDIDTNKDIKFEYSDILASRAGGHSTYQIYSHMRRNKDTWWGISGPTDEYNLMRGELIQRGNATGNLGGNEETSDGIFYSWKHTLENPIWQEIGAYMKASGIESGRNTEWWMYNKSAYNKIKEWLEERAGEGRYDFLERDDRGRLQVGPTTDEHLTELIGAQGVPVTEGVGVPSDWVEGEYWNYWGPEGPRRDGELDLAAVQKISAGLGLGHLNLSSQEEAEILEGIEQRFLREMYVGRPSSSMDDSTPDLPPRISQAKDTWGLDIVRKNMRPEQWQSSWFDGEGPGPARAGDVGAAWFETLAYGDKESIDWAYYNTNHAYQAAQKALGMDDLIDEVSEIREANLYVYARVLADADPSDHLEDWIEYEADFDSDTPIPEPRDIDVGDYQSPDRDPVTAAPAGPTAPTINVPDVDVERPENMPNNLKIAGGTY